MSIKMVISRPQVSRLESNFSCEVLTTRGYIHKNFTVFRPAQDMMLSAAIVDVSPPWWMRPCPAVHSTAQEQLCSKSPHPTFAIDSTVTWAGRNTVKFLWIYPLVVKTSQPKFDSNRLTWWRDITILMLILCRMINAPFAFVANAPQKLFVITLTNAAIWKSVKNAAKWRIERIMVDVFFQPKLTFKISVKHFSSNI